MQTVAKSTKIQLLEHHEFLNICGHKAKNKMLRFFCFKFVKNVGYCWVPVALIC